VTTYHPTWGDALRTARESRAASQQELANLTVPNGARSTPCLKTIHNWEKGHTVPTMTMRDALCRALGVDITETSDGRFAVSRRDSPPVVLEAIEVEGDSTLTLRFRAGALEDLSDGERRTRIADAVEAAYAARRSLCL
jgi:transcriptional regulator with XRE-family HTH domain